MKRIILYLLLIIWLLMPGLFALTFPGSELANEYLRVQFKWCIYNAVLLGGPWLIWRWLNSLFFGPRTGPYRD